MMKAIIVDDELHCREVLEHLLRKYCKDILLLATCESGENAIQALRQETPDILFLDIEMPDMNGFQLLEEFPNPGFNIIFTTAYNEYAIKAIKQRALDYLLKPIDKDELIQAIQKAKEHMQQTGSFNVQKFLDIINNKKSDIRFAVPTLEGLVMVNAEEILYCESDSAYCKLFFVDKTGPLVISKTLKEVQEVINANKDFFRIHHSYLINLKYFKKYIRGEGGEVVLVNNLHLPVSRTRKQDFLNMLNKM